MREFLLDKGEVMSEKKRSVLIVDDEFHIGILIRKLVHWEELGMECRGVLDAGATSCCIILPSMADGILGVC